MIMDEILDAKEQHAQLERIKQDHERTKQQLQQAKHEYQKQQQADNITYITSITITFFSIIVSIILLITILIKG